MPNMLGIKNAAFVQSVWISISLATSSKNFVQIDHHLTELWKKEKGCLFMKHHVYSI